MYEMGFGGGSDMLLNHLSPLGYTRTWSCDFCFGEWEYHRGLGRVRLIGTSVGSNGIRYWVYERKVPGGSKFRLAWPGANMVFETRWCSTIDEIRTHLRDLDLMRYLPTDLTAWVGASIKRAAKCS